MKKQLINILFISGLFVSCIKEKVKTDLIAEKTNILTAGVWRFTDYKYYGGIPTTVITYADLPDCRKDDLRSFNSNGIGETNEGPTKCNTTDPQSQQVTWRFLNNNASSIELNGVIYYIDKLENNEFQFHKKNSDPYAPEVSYGYSR